MNITSKTVITGHNAVTHMVSVTTKVPIRQQVVVLELNPDEVELLYSMMEHISGGGNIYGDATPTRQLVNSIYSNLQPLREPNAPAVTPNPWEGRPKLRNCEIIN